MKHNKQKKSFDIPVSLFNQDADFDRLLPFNCSSDKLQEMTALPDLIYPAK